MLLGSPGSILTPVSISPTTIFSPQFREELVLELRKAVIPCLYDKKHARKGDCSKSPHGPIGTWDVSRVTDMSYIFSGTPFHGDISNWDVSRVTIMSYMFQGASSFNDDISKW